MSVPRKWASQQTEGQGTTEGMKADRAHGLVVVASSHQGRRCWFVSWLDPQIYSATDRANTLLGRKWNSVPPLVAKRCKAWPPFERSEKFEPPRDPRGPGVRGATSPLVGNAKGPGA